MDESPELGNLRFILLIASYIMYLSFGAVVFNYLEIKEELKAIENIDHIVNTFLEKHGCVARNELEDFVSSVQVAVDRGLRVRANVTYNPNWNFGGYGDLAPSTIASKIFCIIYSIVGIPMTATLLSAMVERWTRCVELAHELITRHAGLLQLEAKVVHILLVFIVMVVASCVVFVFPAFVIAKLEDWTYFESIYFCFITMTTVGLGDYTPGCPEKWTDSTVRIIYKVCLVFYFMIGLSFVFLMLDLSGRVPETAPSLLFSCESRFNYRTQQTQTHDRSFNPDQTSASDISATR
eukprot:gene20368-22377_t